jgi:uncharacterized HAD superfamily protein
MARSKVIVLDLDGVIANQLPHLIRYYNKKKGTSYPEEQAFLTPLVGRTEYLKIKREYIEDGMFKKVPPFKGAREFVKKLKKMGFIVVFLTGRPCKRYKRVYIDTVEWLHKNDIPFDAVLATKKKADFIRAMGISPFAFIEDDPRQAADIIKKGFKCILIDRPYNRHYKKAVRAHSYEDIINYLKENQG